MRVVCAWCGLLMKEGSKDAVSHGICKPCEASLQLKFDGPNEGVSLQLEVALDVR